MEPKTQSSRIAAAQGLAERLGSEDVFQALTEEAARRLGVSYAQISVVTDRTIVAAGQTPVQRGESFDLDQSVCPTVVRTDGALISDDLSLDARLASIDAVVHGMARSYAGVPIRLSPEGHVIGVFCAYDPSARHWTDEDLAILEEFAARTLDAIARG
jgi:GAF domain-containing protein